jgi:hypothetical protein
MMDPFIVAEKREGWVLLGTDDPDPSRWFWRSLTDFAVEEPYSGGGAGNTIPKPEAPNNPERWSDEKCKGLTAQIVSQQSSLDAFRTKNGGSYVDNPGLVGQNAAAEFARLHGGSASDYVSQGVGWVGVATFSGEMLARRFGAGALVGVIQTGDTIVNGVSHPTSLGLAGNDLNNGNGASAAGNFAGATANIANLILTGAGAAPGFGWALSGGSAAIFITENIAMARIQSGARSDIVAHYSGLASIEAGAVNRVSEIQVAYDKHCK